MCMLGVRAKGVAVPYQREAEIVLAMWRDIERDLAGRPRDLARPSTYRRRPPGCGMSTGGSSMRPSSITGPCRRRSRRPPASDVSAAGRDRVFWPARRGMEVGLRRRPSSQTLRPGGDPAYWGTGVSAPEPSSILTQLNGQTDAPAR